MKLNKPQLTQSAALQAAQIILLAGLMVGCQAARFEKPPPTPIVAAAAAVTSSVSPTETAVPPENIPTLEIPVTAPTATINPDTGWQTVQGLERRHIFVLDEQNQPRDRLTILRLDPTLYEVRVAYRPGEAQSLEAWQAETEALLVVNGGFFTAENYATGLTVVAGEPFGASYGDFAGMVAITEAGPEIRWLRERPFDLQEPLSYALQSFPMLVKPGGVLAFPDEDGIPARRTVIGQDRNGNLLLIIAPGGLMTLHQMSRWLVDSDLDLHIALNLDGGPSTGLLLADSNLSIPAFSPLPAVITVHEK